MLHSQSCLAGMLCFMTVLAGGNLCADSSPLCGPECLYTALLALDVDPGTYNSFLERVGDVDARGTSLGRLADLAQEFGLSTMTVQTSLDNLQQRQNGPPFACIAHVDGDHFILIGEVMPNTVWTVGPPGEGTIAASVFKKRWPGHALLISHAKLPAEEELPLKATSSLAWRIAVVMILLGLLGWGIINRMSRTHP